ncbi:MAG: D-alanyl-D-alanine carboxypeptidase [Alphaproteobacteria bacterium]|nr:D-alanyl-D-alanine carboxypeptidase [Alphaproteobacteria bacterium]
MFKKVVLGLLLASGVVFNAQAMETKAKYAILMDYDTGDYLFTKDHKVMMPPASMSKLMTVYVLLEKIQNGEISLDDEFVVSENAWRKGGAATGGSTMFLPIGAKVKVSDLLRGIIIQSGNDACIVVAENVSGSEESFAVEMTKKAKELGMENSSFVNSTGLPHPDQRMSVEDLALVSQHIIKKFPEFYEIFSEKVFVYNGIKQHNRNPLLQNMYGADGLKTGHTEEAGYGLTSSVVRDGRRLIGVLSGMSSMKERSEESEKLMSWGFRNFDNYQLLTKDKKIKDIPVWMGDRKMVSVYPQRDVTMSLSKLDANRVKMTIVYDTPVKAPIKQGDVLGQIRIEIPEKETINIPLVASDTVYKKGFFSRVMFNLNYLLFGAKE